MADVASYPIIMIAATPFFIKNLGPEQYGLWMLINVIVQLMNALNFGIGDSTIKEVSHNQAKSNIEKINKSFNYNLSLSILLMILASVIGVIIAQIISHYNVFNIAPSIMLEAKGAIILVSISTGFKLIEQVFLSLFKGLQRFDIASKLNMFSRISVLLSAIGAVAMGFGILQITKITVFINIFNLSIQAFIILKHTQIKTIIPRFNWKNEDKQSSNHIWFWLQSVIALLGFLSDRLIIGHFSDLKTVGYYAIAALIGSQIHNTLLNFGSFVFPKVSANNALNKSTTEIYLLARFIIAGAGWLVIVILLISGHKIFDWWLGTDVFTQSFHYIKLYLAYSAVILLIIVPFYFINGSYLVKLNTLFETTIRSCHVVAMYLSFKQWGMDGLLWSLIITTIINIPFQYYMFNKYILKTTSIKDAFLPIIPALPIILIAIVDNWMLMIILIIFTLLTYKWIYYDKAKNSFGHFIFKLNEKI